MVRLHIISGSVCIRFSSLNPLFFILLANLCRFYDLVEPEHGILRKSREIRLTGCRLRTSTGSGQPRLLPTEYLVILLDEVIYVLQYYELMFIFMI
jgi:hypothetical protein